MTKDAVVKTRCIMKNIICCMFIGIISCVIFMSVIKEFIFHNSLKNAIENNGNITYFRSHIELYELYNFSRGENSYILWIGRVHKDCLLLPSGPPIYIFDADGNLIDFVSDSGDSPSFYKKWPEISSVNKTTER